MEAGRHTWTDSRLDDLQQEMRAGFARVDTDLRSLRSDVNQLQQTMLQVGGGMIVAQLALMVTILGLVLTKL